MKKMGLSVVVPVYNSKEWIGPTLKHLIVALKRTNFDAEIIVVDDGSTDGSAKAVSEVKAAKSIPIVLLEQENTGRYIARKNGVEASSKENILFVDSRVYVDETALAYLEEQLKDSPDQIWNGHVHIDKKGNVFARFWDAIVGVAWRKYFRKPKRTSFGIEQFDYYPKGTGFFYVPKKRLQAAMRYFEKNTNDLRYSSDDTLLIRYLAERQAINLSPEFSCLYHGRSNLKSFLKHAYTRGQFFIDGFLRRGTRFYYPLIGVLLASILGVIGVAVLLPESLLALAAGGVLFMAALWVGAMIFGVSIKDAGSLALLSLPFAVVYLAGLWRGVVRKLRKKGVSEMTVSMWSGLNKKRRFLRGSVLEYFLISLLYVAVTVAVMHFIPLIGITTTIFTQGPGDATSGFVWLNYIDSSLNLTISKTDFVNYPLGEEPGSPIYITYLLLWLPVRILSYLFGPVAGINLVTMLGFVTTATAAYWLAKRLTGSIGVALFAGYALAFFPYAISKGTAHVAYVFNVYFVLLLAAFIAFWKKPTVVRTVLFALSIAACFYFDGYFILLAPVMVIGMIIAGLISGPLIKFKKADYLQRIKMLFLALGVFLVVTAPIVVTSVLQSKKVESTLSSSRSNIDVEIPYYRSWPLDFVVPAADNPLFEGDAQYDALQDYRSSRSDKLSNTSFLGYTNLLLVIIGVTIFAVWLVSRMLRKKGISTIDSQTFKKDFILLSAIFIVCAGLFVSFMLSPYVTIKGIDIPMPGIIFTALDISLWRNMSRFSGPLQVVLVIYAAYVLWVTLNMIRNKKAKTYAMAIVPIVALLSLVPTYLSSINSPPYDLTKQSDTYEWLSGRTDIRVIAQLPLVDPLDEYSSTYSTTQMIHGKKMVNTKDPRYRVQSNVLGSIENPETIDWVYSRGAQAVITRNVPCGDKEWGILAHKDKEGKLCVYMLNKRESVDKYFAVFEKGVDPTPNYAPNEKNTARLNSDTVTIAIKGADLKTNIDGTVRLSAKLVNWNEQAPIPGKWKMTQEGKVVASGSVGPRGSDIQATVDASKKVILTISRENGGNDLLIQQLRVDGI